MPLQCFAPAPSPPPLCNRQPSGRPRWLARFVSSLLPICPDSPSARQGCGVKGEGRAVRSLSATGVASFRGHRPASAQVALAWTKWDKGRCVCTDSMFQTMKRTFQALKCTFQALKRTFHDLKYRFRVRVRALSCPSPALCQPMSDEVRAVVGVVVWAGSRPAKREKPRSDWLNEKSLSMQKRP